MTKLLIFPFNGNGLEALNCLGNDFEFIGFIDDTKEKQGKNKMGFHVFPRSAIKKIPEAKILAVPGSPDSFRIRKSIITQLNIPKNRFAVVIHPKALISTLANIGYNVLIMGGSVVTGNAKIGNHTCLLPNSVVHHDSVVGDYTLVGSGVVIAGNTVIGKNCYLGSGTNIINGVSIGEKTLVGMGSNVINSVPANSKIVGNPARKI